jgi:hypothetical protein
MGTTRERNVPAVLKGEAGSHQSLEALRARIVGRGRRRAE